MAWTDAKIATLRILWARGESATFIAETFGDMTRNAVIGKVHRLGLPYRKTQMRARCSQVAWARKDERERAAKWKSARREATVDIKPNPAKKPVPVAEVVWRSSETPAGALKAMASIMRETETPSGRIGLLDLKEWHCRWPIGDVFDEDFHFCGERKMSGVSFCKEHARIVFQPATRRKRDTIHIPKGMAA